MTTISKRGQGRMQARPVFGASQVFGFSAEDDAYNAYLLSTMDPFNNQGVPIPDLNMTASIPKGFTISQVYTNPLAGANLLITFAPYSTDQSARLFAWDSATSTFNFLQNLLPGEDAAADFGEERTASAGLYVQSATIPGGTFSISGTMNACTVGRMPDVTTLTHSAVPTLKSSDRAYVQNVNVVEGVMAISRPHGDHQFRVPNTAAVYSVNNYLSSRVPSTDPLWTTGVDISTLPTVFDTGTSVANNLFPLGISGQYNLSGKLTLLTTGTFGSTERIVMRINVVTSSADPATFAQVLNTEVYSIHIANSADTAGSYIDIPFNVGGFADGEIIQRVYISTASTTHAAAEIEFAGGDIRFESPSYYASGLNSPGALISIRGLEVDAEVSINAILNKEVVPDSALSRNVKVSYRSREDPLDMQLAEHIWNMSDVVGLNTVYSLRDYRRLVDSGSFTRLARYSVIEQYAAASFKEIMRSVANALLPVARETSGAFGSALGTLVAGPGGSALGRTIGTSIGEALPTHLSATATQYTAETFSVPLLMNKEKADNAPEDHEPTEEPNAPCEIDPMTPWMLPGTLEEGAQTASSTVEYQAASVFRATCEQIRSSARFPIVNSGNQTGYFPHLYLNSSRPQKILPYSKGENSLPIAFANVTLQTRDGQVQMNVQSIVSNDFVDQLKIVVASFKTDNIPPGLFLYTNSPVEFSGNSVGLALWAVFQGAPQDNWVLTGALQESRDSLEAPKLQVVGSIGLKAALSLQAGHTLVTRFDRAQLTDIAERLGAALPVGEDLRLYTPLDIITGARHTKRVHVMLPDSLSSYELCRQIRKNAQFKAAREKKPKKTKNASVSIKQKQGKPRGGSNALTSAPKGAGKATGAKKKKKKAAKAPKG